jgi:hypothetical protein
LRELPRLFDTGDQWAHFRSANFDAVEVFRLLQA